MGVLNSWVSIPNRCNCPLITSCFKPAPPKVSGNFSSPKILSKKAEEKDNRLETERAITQRKHLERMAKLERNEVNLWKSVPFNLNRKTGKSYDLAIESLKDLKQLAIYKNEVVIFNIKMQQIRIDYKRSTSLKRRFEIAKL